MGGGAVLGLPIVAFQSARAQQCQTEARGCAAQHEPGRVCVIAEEQHRAHDGYHYGQRIDQRGAGQLHRDHEHERERGHVHAIENSRCGA